MLNKFWPWNKFEEYKERIRDSELERMIANTREQYLSSAITSIWNNHFNCTKKCSHDTILKELIQKAVQNK